MEVIVVEATRGDVVEARHRVHAVAVSAGAVVDCAGDPELVTHFRSSAKPIQALPFLRARPDLDDREIAIACASHLARPDQLDAVRSLLAKAPATEADLECGTRVLAAGPTRIEHNCSGKHAGLLALCRARGWPSEGYRLLDHPCQQALLAEVAAAAEVDPQGIQRGVDGCGIPTFALPLERMAHAFSRLAGLEGGARAMAAMRAYPELIRGPLAADTMLMQTQPGWVAKGGAEGLLCAVSPDGLGIALKIEDGSTRALRSALATFLDRLGIDTEELGAVAIENSRGEVVGELHTV
ncbi:MAG: asparaginase [Actinomycetota bacterium]|nr:asparaginase [Actinomycetota bacterium]